MSSLCLLYAEVLSAEVEEQVVEAIEADTGRVLWTRSLTLVKDYETLEISATSSSR